MNKKFLSAILFGALMVTSTGTFVSCKDYDDDIDQINNTLNDLKSQIAALQTAVDNGDYVTGVTKTADGKGLTFTFSKGSPVTVTLDVKDGADGQPGEPGKDAQQVTIDEKTGELKIDGEGTGIFPTKDAAKAPVKAEGGYWYTLNDKGEYVNTNIPVSGIAVSGSESEGFTLTVYDANGKEQTVKIPSAASLITSIYVVSDESKKYKEFKVVKAVFTKPSNWGGEKELPSTNSVIYSSNPIDVRINPVDAPVADVKFYLTNTKNHTLSELVLTAQAESGNGPINIGNINGRAANTGNGLYTLSMGQYILDKDAAKAFEKDLTDNGALTYPITDMDAAAAFSVDANKKARSAYKVAVTKDNAESLTKIQIKDMPSSEATLFGNGGSAKGIKVNVGQTYKIEDTTGEKGLLFDTYFSADANTVIETYGLKFDHLNRTFTVTKRPDVVTEADRFILTVNTLDIHGNVDKAKYTISLTNTISSAVTYDAVEYDLTRMTDNNDNNDTFSADIDVMKEKLGESWSQWANSVDFSETKVTLHEKADLSDGGTIISGTTTNGLAYALLNKDGGVADKNTIKYISVKVGAGDKTFTVDTQYYLNVQFNDKNSGKINNAIIPVIFTAPTVAEQFSVKSAYVVENVINAYYYNYATGFAGKSVEVNRYFDKADKKATLTLNDEEVLEKVNTTEYTAYDLAVFCDNKGNAATTDATVANYIRLKTGANNALVQKDGTELGYKDILKVKAYNTNYEGWNFKEDAQKVYNFSIQLMSPIYEGEIKPAEGATINIDANSEEGFPIVKSMISLIDYNKNSYNVVPDVNGKTPTNKGDNAIDAWKAEQILNVWVDKDANNTYIKNIELRGQKDKEEQISEVPGAIMVFADPLPNTTETSMNVHVTDIWGYTKSLPVSVTIVKK